MAQEDLYALLGVKKDASTEEIRRAYRKWAVKLHPDRNPDPVGTAKFKEVSAAYETLSKTDSRKKYDLEYGPDAPPPPPPPDYPVVDLSVQLDLTADELTGGCDKRYTVSRPRTCPACAGYGRIWSSQKKMCVLCQGGGCMSCNYSGSVATDLCAQCWATGQDKELNDIVIRVPPGTPCGGRRRFVANGELWGLQGPFYVDAYVSFRAQQPGMIIR